MASNPTVSDLRKISEVTQGEITAAVDAVLADLKTEPYPLQRGWVLDVVEMVGANEQVPIALGPDQAQCRVEMGLAPLGEGVCLMVELRLSR
ncbi:hypothetical protein MKL09_31670 [Methylobacterium sp. J-048]|uniref:hypothetical protein n=1 Tax=Methylobacterium sp. J-048 TaxID=2836635 RepID=UPI001FB9A960|nr:hypothetical protein [Methylobacterium sp. J-048]MCJ2061064.1 hypothetical protein [Methylobacterium sp. J-048]